MSTPIKIHTVADLIKKLRKDKIGNAFKYYPEGLSADKRKYYQPDELSLTKIYRIEEPTDLSTMKVIYIITTTDGLTGYYIDGYSLNDEDNDDDDNEQMSASLTEEKILQ